MTTPGLLLRCGCEVPFDSKATFAADYAPICPTHGNQVVQRVLRMPKPRIRGVASGPCVQTEDLPAFVGRIVGSEGAKT